VDQGAGPSQGHGLANGRQGSEGLQASFDLLAPTFEERRQGEGFTQRVHRLVRGDLEQDAVRLAEVQAAEPEADAQAL
jgi:hypothetical protein